jgi:hypothetical protein
LVSSRRSARSSPPRLILDRRDVLARIIHTLVDNELRPGAKDPASTPSAPAASTRLIQSQAALTLAQSALDGCSGLDKAR